jgi:phage host-nuclease inhibitor protein Gam
MTRIKPTDNAPVLKTLDDADAALAEIAGLRRHLALVESSMNEDIDAVKKRAAEEAEPVRQQIAALEQRLLRFTDYHRDELFSGGRKTLALAFGSLGYRASTKLKLLAKWTWDRVLQELRDAQRYDCIRVKEEPDKEILKGLDPEYLKTLGCKVVQEDAFFYEVAEQDLEPQPVVNETAA